MNFYKEHIMDHYRYPRNRGSLSNPDFSCDLRNPSCGDSLSMQGSLVSGTITQLVFQAQGCVISQAAASMLTQACLGKNVQEIKEFSPATMLTLLGIELGPMRIRCALLALEALHAALADAGADRHA